MLNSEKEFFLMLHEWRVTKHETPHGTFISYFPPNDTVGTYNLNDAYYAAKQLLDGKRVNFRYSKFIT